MDCYEHAHEWVPVNDDSAALACRWCEESTTTCTSCPRPLARTERVTCAACVSRARGVLARLPGLHAALRDSVRTIVGLDPSRIARGGLPMAMMPGGDALVMLAPGSGSSVTADARGHRSPWDSLDSDPPSVSGVLGDIEDGWRRARRDRAASGPPTVAAAVAYLADHVQWAAEQYPGWAGDLTALVKLTRRIEATAGIGDEEERLPVPCPHCGGVVARRWEHPIRASGQQTPVRGGGLSAWACRSCGERVDMADIVADLDDDLLVTARQASALLGIPWTTVRSWQHRHHVLPVHGPRWWDDTTPPQFRLGDLRARQATTRAARAGVARTPTHGAT